MIDATASSPNRRPLPMITYMRRMWRSAPGICIAHGLGWDIYNLLGLAPGLIVARYLDELTGSTTSTDGLSLLIALMALVAIANAGLIFFAGYFEIQMRFRMSGLVRVNLLRNLLKRPGALPLPYPLGQTISRFRDDAYAAEDTLDWTDEIVFHTLIGIVALILLARIDFFITVTVTVSLLLAVLLTQVLGARLTRYREESSQATSELAGAIGSILGAVQQLQAAGAEERAIARLAALNQQRRRAMTTDAVASRLVDAMSGSLSVIATGLAMLLAADQLRTGSLSVGEFALFLLWIGFVADLTVNLGRYLAFFRQAKVAFRRMDAMLGDAPPEALVAHTPLFSATPLSSTNESTDVHPEPFETFEVTGLTYRHPNTPQTTIGGIEAIKVAWGVLRDKIMADYTRENPGCRPWCWWFVESPEPRQRVDGIIHPFKDRLRKARFDALPDHWYVKRHANDLFFGLPRINLTDEERSAKYETEPQYLLRLDLLTKAERDELFPTMEK